ncbi:MAG: hypothetical protein ONB24_04890, partial [candidate division KSB1 bacterium]|nr:hypothetical protein [candidate division KSB1 bacterium]
LELVAGLVPRKVHYHPPEGLFPQESSFESHAEDPIEKYFLSPFFRVLEGFFRLFSWIQSGRTQQYILYGLVFLLILISLIIGVKW